MIFLKNVLYSVGVPIGNIFDFSQRAIFILKNVDIIATEDSRKTGFLLKFLNIKTKLISLRSENEFLVSKFLINKITNGASVAFVSDSGTPLISDPGFFLLDCAYKNNIKVIPVPGISAFLTALSISSFDIENFIFEGFLPKKKSYKEIFLRQFLYEKKLVILFESSKRLLETLCLMSYIFEPNRKIFIGKELTKKFESFLIFEINKAHDLIKCEPDFFCKGEYVLLLDGVKTIRALKSDFYLEFIDIFVGRKQYFTFIFISSLIAKNIFYDYIF